MKKIGYGKLYTLGDVLTYSLLNYQSVLSLKLMNVWDILRSKESCTTVKISDSSFE